MVAPSAAQKRGKRRLKPFSFFLSLYKKPIRLYRGIEKIFTKGKCTISVTYKDFEKSFPTNSTPPCLKIFAIFNPLFLHFFTETLN